MHTALFDTSASLTPDDLAKLANTEGPWITILTPLHGGGPEAKKEDPLRFRSLVREAAAQLEARRDADGTDTIDPDMIEQLRAVADDSAVFNAGAPAMVVFANAGGIRLWHLPETVHECAVVDERPFLEPLLPIVSEQSDFYVVTLTLHGTKLWACDRHQTREVPLPSDAPGRLEDAAGWDVEEQHLQYHSIKPGRGGGMGSEGAGPIYHGQGGGTDDRDVDIEKYVRAIDKALAERIRPDDERPIVLACDPKVEGIFRRVTHLKHVLDTALHGNFETADTATLHGRAWELIEPLITQRLERERERYLDLRGNNRTSDKIEDVVPFAVGGRVETLFVCDGVAVEGAFDEAQWKVRLGQNGKSTTTNLVGRAASDTFLHGGRVYVVSPEAMPTETPVAAILRW